MGWVPFQVNFGRLDDLEAAIAEARQKGAPDDAEVTADETSAGIYWTET